ncbi:MAG: 4Fe-4S binding protein [Elusimicrobia bacterium]|nr:4Fe-4S binding protein [Elusimicrobiota bacterium]
MAKTSKKIVLKFPHRLIEQPIVCDTVKKYNLDFNILKAYITPREEGLLVLEFTAEEDVLNDAIKHLTQIGVIVQNLSQDVLRNEVKCTHCGACVVICPAGALVMDHLTKKVLFYDNKCIACELCIKACPTRAMELHF